MIKSVDPIAVKANREVLAEMGFMVSDRLKACSFELEVESVFVNYPSSFPEALKVGKSHFQYDFREELPFIVYLFPVKNGNKGVKKYSFSHSQAAAAFLVHPLLLTWNNYQECFNLSIQTVEGFNDRVLSSLRCGDYAIRYVREGSLRYRVETSTKARAFKTDRAAILHIQAQMLITAS